MQVLPRPTQGRAGRALALASLGTALTVLAVSSVFFALRRATRPSYERPAESQALADAEVRSAVIARLVSGTSRLYDSHPDPDVGRVLLPGMEDTRFLDHDVTTNQLGMREAEYELPKPPGVARIVFLGDSYVFGHGVSSLDRMGVFLQAYLENRSPNFEGRLECLHLGVSSWNAISETEYLRRQLSELQPDLVVQLLGPNDLDDTVGVRGFGAMGSHVPRHRQRADGRVFVNAPGRYPGAASSNLLLMGMDWESQQRYEEAVAHLGRLADRVVAQGGRYLLAVHWSNYKEILRPYLEEHLRPEEVCYLPARYRTDPQYWVAEDNPHWNRRGHEAFARIVFALVRQRDLLPTLSTEPWPQVEETALADLEEGRIEATRDHLPRLEEVRERLLRSLDFQGDGARALRQVHGGVDLDGRLSPYASMVLPRLEGASLFVEGRYLERPELQGSEVRIWADQALLGTLELGALGTFARTFELPPEVAARETFSLRFESEDWVYGGSDRRRCESLRLDRVGEATP